MENWVSGVMRTPAYNLGGSQVQELARKRIAAQTKAVISRAAEGGCWDRAVEMIASDSSPVWLLARFTGVKDPSEVRSLTLRGVDRLVPVSIPFWICCDLVCCVKLPRYFWNGFSFSHSWKVESSSLSVWLVCWSWTLLLCSQGLDCWEPGQNQTWNT